MPDVHPELKAGIRRVPSLVLSPWKVRLARLMMPVMRPKISTDGLAIKDHAVPGASTMARIYRPESASGPLPVVFWIHGGGLVIGDYKEDGWARQFLTKLDVALVSVGYRLAPKHPFPAALDDLVAAFEWVTSQGGQLGLDASQICIAGESAGGGLAAALVQRLHDQGVNVDCQLLVYPMLDDRTAVRSDIGAKDHLVWTNGSNRFGWESYLGAESGGESAPEYAVPGRRRDLSGLPPTWIGVGDIDLFHDECLDYASRLQEADVACDLVITPGAPHGFPSFSPGATPSKDFVASAVAFLRRSLEISGAARNSPKA